MHGTRVSVITQMRFKACFSYTPTWAVHFHFFKFAPGELLRVAYPLRLWKKPCTKCRCTGSL
jgi:hypothetical protein